MTVAQEVIEFAERIGRPMLPWQAELTRAMLQDRRPAFALYPGSRGRTAHKRTMTEFSAVHGEHVHSVGHDGEWCVTLQPVGFLYARVRSSRR